MNQDQLNREWVEVAPAWIREAREGANPTRTGLLDRPMLQACGPVEGAHILDCGCGEGRFCRMLVQRGAAYVLGLDLCTPMVEAARELQGKTDQYEIADVQDLGFLSSESFDLCVSYLNQCDLPDFEANNREVFRILKRGGRFVVANLHPMRSAVGGWHRSGTGEKLHVIVDRYFDDSPRHWRMMGTDFTNFHRSLSTYVRSFLRFGFVIADLIEPTVTEDQLDSYPELDDEMRVPNFIIYVLTKL
jgi:SAM-dependent methyltransferase